MQNRKMNTFLGILAAILIAVAIFVLFADAFGKVNDLPSSRGSVYQIMFGNEARNLPAVGGLIAAWVLLLVGFLFGIISAFLPGKVGAIGCGITAICAVVAGILFCCTVPMYKAAYADILSPAYGDNIVNGAGTICAIIFSFLGGALSLYTAYSDFKA